MLLEIRSESFDLRTQSSNSFCRCLHIEAELAPEAPAQVTIESNSLDSH